MKYCKNKVGRPLDAEYKQTRNEIILRMRKDGFSLQKIGDRFNVSREYIRQILQKEFDITGHIIIDPKNEVLSDEYTVFDIAKILGIEILHINNLLRQQTIPKPSRLLDKSQHQGLDKKFWKRKDIDKWINIKLKHLKIQLEKSIKGRMSKPAPYKFGHYRVQELYSILQMAKAGDLKSLSLYVDKSQSEVMQEFNDVIKPVKYIPTDYSKYINQKSRHEYHKEGLYTAYETEKITKISRSSIFRYRNLGFLKKGTHFITGDHYFYRTMYYPKKMKQAMIDAGYDFLQAARIIEAKALSKKGKN